MPENDTLTKNETTITITSTEVGSTTLPASSDNTSQPVPALPGLPARTVYNTGDWIEVYRNQGYRSAQILAYTEDAIGNRVYLVEYHMPTRWTALNFIQQRATDMDITDHAYICVAYKQLSAAWLGRMLLSGTKWKGWNVFRQQQESADVLHNRLTAPKETEKVTI